MKNFTIQDESLPHFLTCTTTQWLPLFNRPYNQDVIIDSLRYCQTEKGLIIYGWVLMIDHLHLVARAQEPKRLSWIMRDFKRHTARKLFENLQTLEKSRKAWMEWIAKSNGGTQKRKQNFKIWKEGCFAIPLINNKDFDIKLDYIHQNPVKQNLVRSPEDWQLSSAIDYCGGKGLLDVELLTFG